MLGLESKLITQNPRVTRVIDAPHHTKSKTAQSAGQQMSENPEGTSLARRISSVAGVEHQGELRPSRDLRRSQDVEYVPTHVARSHRRSFLQDDGDKKVAPGPIKEHRISFDKKAFGKDPDKDDEHAKLPWNKRFVIHPLGMFRFFWDIGMTALVVYVAIMTPVRLALFWSEFDEESLSNSPWLISELIIDIVFLLDIVLNFFTGTWRHYFFALDIFFCFQWMHWCQHFKAIGLGPQVFTPTRSKLPSWISRELYRITCGHGSSST